MFETIRRSYWWPKLWQNIVKYIDKCSICAKHLPIMTRYPQQHLEILQIPLAVLTIDTIGCLPITSKGNRWALTAIYLHVPYVLAIQAKDKSAENVVQAYLSGILAQKGGSVAILGGNVTEYVTTYVLKGYSLTCFIWKGNAKVENVHNFLKGTLTKSWTKVM